MPARKDWPGGRSKAGNVVLSKILISLDLLPASRSIGAGRVLLNPCLPACIWQAAGKKLKKQEKMIKNPIATPNFRIHSSKIKGFRGYFLKCGKQE
jgi:hypothetical protein